ncbi:MarR family transcriptional regulator [Actinoallomurus bryophytorum]|uniref:DNA-binding MarR family transcriptional regulator n=1 Tax=Actinoallomurus bryophytorum TaxID=1490222 RepID=A0A543CU31_9ACTN|nr:MarR family transcriptional regulator [Actinoallomurus bryophytorum]TQM00615.1 DNA-binding MarR family transcriptional regulator [Actinoallomurus bryophytorum]
MTARTVGAEEALDVVIAMHRLMRRLRRAGNTGAVHPTQLIVLALLMQYGPLRVGELARRVPCSQPTATTAVAGLLAAGFVDREPDPTDGRAIRVAATDAGRAILQSFAHGEAEVLSALMSAIPEEDARLLLTAAPVLSTLADLPAPPSLGPVPDGDSPLPHA